MARQITVLMLFISQLLWPIMGYYDRAPFLPLQRLTCVRPPIPGLMLRAHTHELANVSTDTTTTLANNATIDYFNFAKMIQRYIRMFVKSDTADALQYVYLICLSADAPGRVGQEQTEVCRNLISDVIMETKNYGLLLGSSADPSSENVGTVSPPRCTTFAEGHSRSRV